MKNFPTIALSAAAVLWIGGCSLAEKYERNAAATEAWLAAQTEPAKIDISGDWHSEDWGDAYFVQKRRNVTGHIGRYMARGVVSGRNAYLAVHEDGWTYYTAVVGRPTEDLLEGFYSSEVPYAADDRDELEFRKIR